MTKDLGLHVQETFGQEIIRKRLERGDIEENGFIIRVTGKKKHDNI